MYSAEALQLSTAGQNAVHSVRWSTGLVGFLHTCFGRSVLLCNGGVIQAGVTAKLLGSPTACSHAW
jgi:hypothetical protein